jgi:DNA polymerase-1
MLSTFAKIWCVDFEFQSLPGEIPTPICAVCLEVNSGEQVKLFGDELVATTTCPYSVGADSLMVAYMASAELSCHQVLGWAFPENVLDLYPEFRRLTNGMELSKGSGLLGALHYFKLNPMSEVKKQAMRVLAQHGGPWTESERKDLLEYCGEDTEALASLLSRMAPSLDLPRALLRGRYMKAAALIEHIGIPVNAEVVRQIKTHWTSGRRQFIEDVDADYGVYEETRFSQKKFREWLEQEGIDWPTYVPKRKEPSRDHQAIGSTRYNPTGGSLRLDRKTFKAMAQRYPQVEPLRNLRQMLSQFRDLSLPVGTDSYSRTRVRPFRAKTGRNQPSTTKFIFGLSKWSRQLIQPTPGNALAYLDWKQQEFGIAAALSGDTVMMDAYRTGDPYLAFAKQAGAVPEDATQETHGAKREQYKQCALAVQYGMGIQSLAERLGISVTDAQLLLAMHHRTYRKFWRWSDATVDYARLYEELYTVFGWRLHVTPDTTERTLRNFPMQANGAEMLRLACCMLTEQGIRVCAPIHDAVLIEAPVAEIDAVVAKAQDIMAEASALVLDGFTLSTDKMCITETTPWKDEKGKQLWDKLIKHLPATSPEVADDSRLEIDDFFLVSSHHVGTTSEVGCDE